MNLKQKAVEILKENLEPFGFEIRDVSYDKERVKNVCLIHKELEKPLIIGYNTPIKVGIQKNIVIDMVHSLLTKIGMLNYDVIGVVSNDFIKEFLEKYTDNNSKYKIDGRGNLKLIPQKKPVEVNIKYYYKNKELSYCLGDYNKYSFPLIVEKNLFTYSFSGETLVSVYYMKEFIKFLKNKLYTEKYRSRINDDCVSPMPLIQHFKGVKNAEAIEMFEVAMNNFTNEIVKIIDTK